MSNDPYITLAQKSLRYYFETRGILPVPTDLPEEMLQKRHGAFVSIHKNGRLRGCIGTIHPTKPNVASEIIHNAISAATHDWRFRPIEQSELPALEISVDVLFPPEPIESMDQLDIKRYGVVVRSGFKSGLLLPNLDGIRSVEEQVDIASRKAGIGAKDNIKLERFEVIRHEDK